MELTEPTLSLLHASKEFKQIILLSFISYGSAVHALVNK
jgi:hypothetical protein